MSRRIVGRAKPKAACSVSWCDKSSVAFGLCRMHYIRQRRGIDLNKPKRKSPPRRSCSVPSCTNDHAARGYCESHYVAWKYHEFDDELKPDDEIERKPDSLGYIRIKTGSGCRFELEHRMIMAQIIGRPLERHENVHHKNGNRADNRPSNLELWSKKQPAGQRIEDKLKWAYEIIEMYEPLIKRIEHATSSQDTSPLARSLERRLHEPPATAAL